MLDEKLVRIMSTKPPMKKIGVLKGDPNKGEKIFVKECAICHLKEQRDDCGSAAPSFFNVLGWRSSTNHFSCNNAMKKLSKVCNKENLFQYLVVPAKLFLVTKMSFTGVRD